jgi:hypothetical protein
MKAYHCALYLVKQPAQQVRLKHLALYRIENSDAPYLFPGLTRLNDQSFLPSQLPSFPSSQLPAYFLRAARLRFINFSPEKFIV